MDKKAGRVLIGWLAYFRNVDRVFKTEEKIFKVVVSEDKFSVLKIFSATTPTYVPPEPELAVELMEGLMRLANQPPATLDPLVHAAVVSFAFVFIHPFMDGMQAHVLDAVESAVARAMRGALLDEEGPG